MQNSITVSGEKNGMKLSFIPYDLQLKHTFSISGFSRSVTPGVLVEIYYEGVTGYGEASMPPYLGESKESVLNFLSKVNISQFADPLKIEEVLDYIDKIAPGNYAAKASVDIALHDLAGKLLGKPWFRIWELDPLEAPYTSMTIGIDKPSIVSEKVKEANEFKILKIKLGSGNDKEMINTVREVTDKPLFVDVNQGWTDRVHALEMAHWLKERNVVLLEQPMPAERLDDLAWLTANSPLPVIADEGIKTLDDLNQRKEFYSGINIKLMKCGGLHNAYQILQIARKAGMKIMIGCMTETSCAVSAAAQLSPAADWADLDGNHLIANDCFEGVAIIGGKISLNEEPGIGLLGKRNC